METTGVSRKRAVTPTSPINFRMPVDLRSRLRAFARKRHLGESDALRVILAEHFAEIDDARQRADAEAWQIAQAVLSWEDFKAGRNKPVPRADVYRVVEQIQRKRESRQAKLGRRAVNR